MISELVSVGEVARRLDVSPSLLRKLEASGVTPPARRIAGYDRRVYDSKEIEELRKIIEERRAANSRQPVEAA